MEGLGRVLASGAAPVPADLDPLQTAFLETGGAQCGICTPGMLMAGHAFLASGAPPTDEAIREAIAGNLCRCTGYTKIVEAIALAAAGSRTAPVSAGSRGPAIDTAARPRGGHVPHAGRTAASVAAPRSRGRGHRSTRGRSRRRLASGADGPRRYRPIAGGTDLMVQITGEIGPPPDRLLDLWRLDELRGIAVQPADGRGPPGLARARGADDLHGDPPIAALP